MDQGNQIQKSKDVLPTFVNKLYRADIIDIDGNYLAKTVKSIDIGIKTSDVIDKTKTFIKFKYYISK